MRRTGRSKPTFWHWWDRFLAEGVNVILYDPGIVLSSGTAFAPDPLGNGKRPRRLGFRQHSRSRAQFFDEEVTGSAGDESVASAKMPRQDLAAISAPEDDSPDPGASPDNRVLHVSEIPPEQVSDPAEGDRFETNIGAVEEGESNSPLEHEPPKPDTGLQDGSVSAAEPETGDKTASQPSIDPVALGKDTEVQSLAHGRRGGPVEAVDASFPAGGFDHGVIPPDEEARDSAEDDSGAFTAPDVDPGLRAAIVNRAVYNSIVTRAVSTKSCPVVEKVLADPSVDVSAGTQPRVIPPGTLGSGVDHSDTWSLVFVPDDGRSPVLRILFDKDGIIIGRVGPYDRA